MTREEALHRVEGYLHADGYSDTKEIIKALECEPCDDVISRQNEPIQVELEGDGYADGELVYDYGRCPKCGWSFEEGDKDWEEPFCCHCGQKLEWFGD